jgi:hypothetical protein
MVEVGVEASPTEPLERPLFQRAVGRAQSEGGHPDVEVTVDQARHDEVVVGTDDRCVLDATQILVPPDPTDTAAGHEEGTVLDDRRSVAARGLDQDTAASDERGVRIARHVRSLELAQARVEPVPQPVPEEIEGQNHHQDGEAWKD